MLTSENIDKEVNQEGLILVKFISDSCKECQKMDLVLNKITYPIYTVDIDKEPNLMEDYDVEIIPTILLFLNGQLIEKIVGFKTKTTLMSIINAIIN